MNSIERLKQNALIAERERNVDALSAIVGALIAEIEIRYENCKCKGDCK